MNLFLKSSCFLSFDRQLVLEMTLILQSGLSACDNLKVQLQMEKHLVFACF